MTVNHDVAGSSPAGGAIKGDYFFVSHLFYFEKLGSNSKRCKCTSDTITPFFVTKNLYQDDRLEMSIGHF